MRMPRFSVNAMVDFGVEGTLTRFRSTTRDVSEGGVLIQTMAPLAVGMPVELRLGSRGIRLRGNVARTGPCCVAVQLGDPESAGRRRLRRHLRSEEGREALAST